LNGSFLFKLWTCSFWHLHQIYLEWFLPKFIDIFKLCFFTLSTCLEMNSVCQNSA
jgi:hypothetical protein